MIIAAGMTLNRREFVRTTAGAGIAAVAATGPSRCRLND